MWRWIFIASVAAVSIVLGLWGFTEVSAEQAANTAPWIVFLNNLWRTIALFTFETDLALGTDNGKLVLARLLAPVATLGAVLEISLKFFDDRISLLRAGFKRGHTIIVGGGEHGRRFLDDCHGSGKNGVVVVDRSIDPSIKQNVKTRKAVFIQSDAREISALRKAGLAKAAQLIIAGGDDSQNLEVLNAAKAVQRLNDKPLNVLVRIDNRLLVRQLDREDDFAHSDNIEITPFNAAAVTARRFFAKFPLADQASLRAQQRIHLVAIGWTPFVFEALEQLARLSPYRSFGKACVDLLVRNPDGVRKELMSIQPAIWDVLDLALSDLEDESGIPTPQQIKDIEPGPTSTVTAVLVSLGQDATTAGAALAIRERTHRAQRWRGPVFVHLTSHSALSQVIEQRAMAPDPFEQVIPVGFQEDACSLDAVLGDRERLACRIHESYRAFKGADRAEDAAAMGESALPWDQLKQTYKLANRRASDHFPIKLMSVGVVQQGAPFVAPKDFRLITSDRQMEVLAELEHISWAIDRRLDGWRPGETRDDVARTHPSIVAYDQLTEAMKDFDREQIQAIAGHLLEEGKTPTVRYESRIGLFGHNGITTAQRGLILQRLDEEILPTLIQSNEHKLISICTPLAPGSDVILAEAVLDRLAAAKLTHRLVVIRALPMSAVIDDYEPNYQTGNEWRRSNDGPVKSDWPAAREEIAEHLEALMAKAPDTVIADLMPPGLGIEAFAASEDLRISAYRRGAAWLVEKCDVLVAFHEPSRPGGLGGTAETIAWAQGTKDIPADFSTLNGEKLPDQPQMITIEG